jgi:hypothetical protein
LWSSASRSSTRSAATPSGAADRYPIQLNADDFEYQSRVPEHDDRTLVVGVQGQLDLEMAVPVYGTGDHLAAA